MLAIIYLIIIMFLGNLACRRFYDFVSLPHRLAGNFLVGFLFSTWATYLFALVFTRARSPLLWGNLVFFLVSGSILFWFYKRDSFKRSNIAGLFDFEKDKFDWIFTGLFFLISAWLMFGAFGLSDNFLETDAIVWNDFGPNLSLVRSFAVGHNFPTEYPHFIGEPIRYHFLFWFQAGNLEFLGLDIDWSLNILSTLTMTSMLVLIATVGQIAFNSKAVGRIAALLFFFFGTFSYIPFLMSKGSVGAAFHAIINTKEWLMSIYTYPGEQWGVWALGTFMAQRHLATSIGIFLFVFIFLIQNIKAKMESTENQRARLQQNANEFESIENESQDNQDLPRNNFDSPVDLPLQAAEEKRFKPSLQAYIFAGMLLGLLPLWNSAVYVSAGAVFAGLLLFFPNRLYTLILLVASAIVALPQILFLRASESKTLADLFHWGYVVDPATVPNVLKYFAFTFGLKTLLALFALAVLSAFHRRLFLALLVLPILTFSTKLSTDIMNNHKFIHIWMIFINLFVAYAIWRLYKAGIAGKIAAALLVVAVAFGGTIELFRIYNDDVVKIPFSGGPLYEWLYAETKPEDVFLSPKYVHHPILLAGRRIFYGSSYFGWSMGYKTGERDTSYKQMFGEQNLEELLRLLRANNIKYIAYDDDVRNGDFKNTVNESVSQANFQKVFVDTDKKYNSLVIYKVPEK